MKKYLLFLLLVPLAVSAAWWNPLSWLKQELGASVFRPFQGGTGTSTVPTYGKVLVGNDNGNYDVVATSTLGFSLFPFTPTTNFNQAANATTTAIWLQGSPFSLFASSTAVFGNASTSLLTIGYGGAGIDYSLTFDGENSNGRITWLEDEAAFSVDDGAGGAVAFNLTSGSTFTTGGFDINAFGGITADDVSGYGADPGSGAQQLLVANNNGASRIVATLRAVAGQTADILQLQNSSSGVLTKFDFGGNLTVPNATSTNATTTNFAITGLATPAGTFAAIDPTGRVIATTTPTSSTSAATTTRVFSQQTPLSIDVGTIFYTTEAITITQIASETDTGTVQFNVEYRPFGARDLSTWSRAFSTSTAPTADADGDTQTSFTDATVGANTWVVFVASSTASTPTQLDVAVSYQVD